MCVILNRIIITEGNRLRFHVNHTVNNEDYVLKDGEKYHMTIAAEDNPEAVIFSSQWTGSDFDMKPNLKEGIYVFEISFNDGTSTEVIMPALDERHRPLNQLIVLRRLSNS